MKKFRNKGVVRRRAQFDGSDNNYVRSQTLAGYEPTDAEFQEVAAERTLAQKRDARKRRSVTTLATIIGVAVLALLVASQFTAGVSSVWYEQANVTDGNDEEYIAFVNQYLANHPSERFSWGMRGGEFLKEARGYFPEILSISVGAGFFDGGKVNVSLRQPVAVWKSGDKRSYVDSKGAIFEKNHFDEPNIEITDLNTANSGNGVSGRLLEFIGKVIAGIESSGIYRVQEISIPATSARYIEIKLAGKNYPIKAQIDRDVDSQATDVVNMVKFLDEKGISPSYVDVRVKNRGYYK